MKIDNGWVIVVRDGVFGHWTTMPWTTQVTKALSIGEYNSLYVDNNVGNNYEKERRRDEAKCVRSFAEVPE